MYPGEFRDGNIPFGMFWLLWSQFYRIMSLEKLVVAEAYMLGRAVSNGSDKSKQQIRHLSDFAYGLRETP